MGDPFPSARRTEMRAVIWFLLLTFGLTWGLWSALLVPQVHKTPLLVVAILAIGMWGPGLVAILVTRGLLREPLSSTTINGLGRRWYYAWAMLLPIAGTLAALGLTVLVGLARFDPELTAMKSMFASAGKPVPETKLLWLMLGVQAILGVPLGALFNCLFSLGEELGWRGFLLLRLMRAGLGPWAASALTGVIWGLWHAPVIIGLEHNYPGHPYWGAVLMTVLCVLMGVIFGWLQPSSGSVWAPTLAHGALNAVAGLPKVLLTPHDSALGGTLTSVGGLVVLSLFVAWLFWSRRLTAPQAPPPAGQGLEPIDVVPSCLPDSPVKTPCN